MPLLFDLESAVHFAEFVEERDHVECSAPSMNTRPLVADCGHAEGGGFNAVGDDGVLHVVKLFASAGSGWFGRHRR